MTRAFGKKLSQDVEEFHLSKPLPRRGFGELAVSRLFRQLFAILRSPQAEKQNATARGE